jgi:uncharacterized protein YcsI (UPF0317 family)
MAAHDVMADQQPYHWGTGSLLHVAQCTRPDIGLAVTELAAHQA